MKLWRSARWILIVVNEMDVPILVMGARNLVVAASPEGILVADKGASSHIKPYVENLTQQVIKVDGLSVEFDNWRFNLRKSNTEPVIRLNVETRQDEDLMKDKTAELLAFMLPRG